MERDVILLFADRCTRCTHLYANAPKTFNKCHFTAGNENCPAQYIELQVRPAETAESVEDIIKRCANDPKKLADALRAIKK